MNMFIFNILKELGNAKTQKRKSSFCIIYMAGILPVKDRYLANLKFRAHKTRKNIPNQLKYRDITQFELSQQ